MKLLYIANIRVPTDKAHGIQIVKTCEALSRRGVSVELIVPDRKPAITGTIWEYHDVHERFPITRLSVWDTISWGRYGFHLEAFSFVRSVRHFLRRLPAQLVFSRDEYVLAFLPARFTYVWETHVGSWNWFARRAARRAACIIAITEGLKEFYVERGIDADRIKIAPDGVTLTEGQSSETREEARRRLSLPESAPIVLYAGSLDGWKGTDTLLRAVADLPQEVCVCMIGGTQAQVATLRARYPTVRFLGMRPYRELHDNLRIANVLVLPNTGTDTVSARFTSPLKLFAYMASGVPIVASDLPSIREVLDDRACFFTEPDTSPALARAIMRVLADPREADRRAERARELARNYTWDARAERIQKALA